MSLSDPVADMLTKIRNASSARFESVDIPTSKLKLEITKILKNEGYIKTFKKVTQDGRNLIRIFKLQDRMKAMGKEVGSSKYETVVVDKKGEKQVLTVPMGDRAPLPLPLPLAWFPSCRVGVRPCQVPNDGHTHLDSVKDRV